MKILGQSLAWLSLALLLTACESTPTTDSPDASADTVVTKSPNDARDYRFVVLDNGLRVLLISDMEADKSAASMTVFRGSFHDPIDRPGLAHFLEHMLFIGTEKYPDPDGYFSYIQANGGSSNAYTATDHTNYFFDVRPEAFGEGLDRFAQFFISPLFQKEYVEREKNAVNSEYQLQLKEDGWRSFIVKKVAVNPAHPMSQFNIGTLDTLAGDVHSALLEFFEEQYSANQMGLVVLTNEPLDDMEPWVTEMFSAVENRNLPANNLTLPLFLDNQLPATLKHDNVKNAYRVEYGFPLPSVSDYYDRKPLQYVSNLIGHEGEGSLHKLLNSKGWINSLSAGESEIDEANSVMNISIDLTEEGANHVPEITAYLFAYLDLLKANPPSQRIYDEQATVAELAFRFKEKSSAMRTVQSIAPDIAYYPPEDLLVAPYLMESFDPDLISRFIEELTTDNVAVTVSSPDYEGESTEQWFGVSYDLTRGTLDMAEVETDALGLPPENPFLPEDLTVIADDGKPPVQVIASEGVSVYLDTDTEFGVPRAMMHVSLQNDGGLIALKDAVRAQLYGKLVRDDLNALTYPALLAGVDYQLATPPRGFRVSVGGYHDKQLVLLAEVLQRVTSLEIDSEKFDLLKSELIRDLRNIAQERPYLQTYQRLNDELLNASWTPTQMLEELEMVTLADLTSWRDETLADVAIQSLVHGNVTDTRVEALVDLLDQFVEMASVNIGEPTVVEVEAAREIDLDIDHDDASIVIYLQDDEDGFATQAKSSLLSHLLQPGYFSSLRTEQQLGYVVTIANIKRRMRGGMAFIIQSPVAGPAVLREKTLEFMQAQVDMLAAMSDEEFEANKAGLFATLTQKDKNLRARSSRYWADLDAGIVSFDARLQLASEVAALDKQTMVQFHGEMLEKLQNRYLQVSNLGRFEE